jgi:hypothetical protein
MKKENTNKTQKQGNLYNSNNNNNNNSINTKLSLRSKKSTNIYIYNEYSQYFNDWKTHG